VVVSYDALSALGATLETQWEKAAAGGSGIGRLTRFPLRENFPVEIAGQVAAFDPQPFPFLSPRKMALWTSPIFGHGLVVVHRALAKTGLEITPELSPRVATTFSTAIGGLDAVLEADRDLAAKGKLPAPSVNPNSCVNMVGGKISMLINATGPIVTSVAACATGTTSMILGAMFLKEGMADLAVCGAVDFPLVEPIVAGFATMNGAYRSRPDRPEAPEKASRPFSRDRRGFVISEGAGCIILATREFAQAHGLDYKIEMAGWAMNADAYHYTAPREDTIAWCMKEAVGRAGISPADIQAVNAHAASTKVGDQAEHRALREVFGAKIPPVSANKSQLGHAMGAASALESIFAMEGMLRETALPTINYRPDPDLPLDCVPEGARKLKQEFVLKNAFGFGGCNACIVFRRVS
jgi:3-oxoacyl-[acyl-carrier-protein] synthase II